MRTMRSVVADTLGEPSEVLALTQHNRNDLDQPSANPLVAGSRPFRPTSGLLLLPFAVNVIIDARGRHGP